MRAWSPSIIISEQPGYLPLVLDETARVTKAGPGDSWTSGANDWPGCGPKMTPTALVGSGRQFRRFTPSQCKGTALLRVQFPRTLRDNNSSNVSSECSITSGLGT